MEQRQRRMSGKFALKWQIQVIQVGYMAVTLEGKADRRTKKLLLSSLTHWTFGQ